MSDLKQAKERLLTGGYTCVLRRGEKCYTSTLRGVKPLYTWLQGGVRFESFSAADKVVGKATAFLYALLGVQEVYAGVISESALKALNARGIAVEYGEVVPYIINRRGDGICPFEGAVLDIEDEKRAYLAIKNKIESMENS